MASSSASSTPPAYAPMNFEQRMIQIERKLKIEGRGRDRAFIEEVEKQFARLVNNTALRPRQNPLKLFAWRLFEAVSNHFWPGSVRPADMPPNTGERSKPFVNLSLFRAVDTSVLSLPELLLFIQSNGHSSFLWPRKPRAVVRRQRGIRLHSQRPENGGHDTISPLRRSATRRRRLESKTSPAVHHTPGADSPSRPVLDDDHVKLETRSIHTLDATEIATPLVPTLSVSCRPGWDLNKNSTGIATMPMKGETRVVGFAPSFKARQSSSSSSVRPQTPGAVLFKPTPQEDKDEFLKKFLGREEREVEKEQDGQQTMYLSVLTLRKFGT